MEEICLIIKAPSSKHEDFKINCQLSWTILDLKIQICKEYPSKPNISDQRLIYSGHLLKDEQSLRDIIQLSDDNDTYTFHLVCSQRPVASNKNTTSADSSNKSTSSGVADASISAGSSSATMAPNPVPSSSSSPATSPPSNPALNGQLGQGNPADMRESYYAMMNQYYQYMSYYYLSSPPAAIPDYASYYAFPDAYMRGMDANGINFPNPFTTPAYGNNNNNAIPGANLNVQANPPVVAANANNRNANNANNQPDNDDNRDWTEMLYSFSKAMVMFSIMYFYSSFGRLLLLLAIAFFLYLYKTARLTGLQNILNNPNNNNNEQPRMEQQPVVLNNNNNNQEANNNNENRETEGQGSPDGEVAGNASTPNAPAVPDNSRYSGLRLVWVFVTSLFTSLIPDPTPIN